jgi:hypothetical protein
MWLNHSPLWLDAGVGYANADNFSVSTVAVIFTATQLQPICSRPQFQRQLAASIFTRSILKVSVCPTMFTRI